MKRSVLLATVLATVPAAAQTPPDSFRLAEIVVTASKVPLPLAAVPAHVTVLTGDALRGLGTHRVVDALRDAAGISVAQLGAPGAVASLFLRGGESDYVQVLVDGVQVNEPGGAFDWGHLTTADVERIEIVRGPASVLYGSDAVAGVVQIFTRRGAGAPRVHAELGAGVGERVGPEADGGYATWNASAGVTGSAALRSGWDASYSANAARQQSDGAYAYNNEYGNTTLAARLALANATGTRLTFTTRYTDQEFHYPTSGAGLLVDRNQYTHGKSLSASLAAAHRLSGALDMTATLTRYRNDTGGRDPEDEPGQGFSNSSAEVTRNTAELRVDARLDPALTASAGAEYEQQQGATTFDSDGPFGPFSSSSDDERASRALYAQLVRAGEHVGITLGARLDDSDQFGSFGTARVGASLLVAAATRVHASLGTGFKEPTFFETYATGFAVGNPALEPERSRSLELGIRTRVGGADVAISAFDQRFRNLIQYTPSATQDGTNYVNVGEARARGVEAEATAQFDARTELRAAYTLLDTEVLDEGFGADRSFTEGEHLLRRPKHQLRGTVTRQFTDAWRAGVSASYVGERDDLDFTDPNEWQGKRVTMPAHTTFDVTSALRVRSLELTLDVRNALDERYAEVYNFLSPGRVITLGVRY